MKELMEFIFQPEVQEIFDNFYAVFGIRIAFFSPAGEELHVGQQKPIYRFCRLLREKMDFASVCLELDRAKRAAAAEKRKLIAYQCHAGLTEAVMPVYILDRLIGFVMIGQFHCRPGPPPALRRRWKAKFNNNDLENAFLQVPDFTLAKGKNILGLFEILVKYIVSQHMIGLKSRNTLQPVLSYLHEHVDRNLTLAGAATIACRSPSTLSHLFRKLLGKSFKQVQIGLKLERAEEYFRTIPGVTVKEVAYKIGYDDPFYFSRIFKKYRGIAPTNYLRKLRIQRD